MSIKPLESEAERRRRITGPGPAARWSAVARLDSLLWAVAGVLLLLAVAAFAWGCFQAWERNSDGDMQTRLNEYTWFRQGVYPNRHLAGPVSPRAVPYTVYPPYALPMFAFFFEPDGLTQGRVLVEVLSLASLVVIGFHGFRSLRFAGPALAAVGAVSGAAVVANSTALALGQFSILCVGLIVQQQLFLQRHRQYAAGICWALAMIKPQIGLAFALLFVIDRQWRGLLLGLVIVAALSLFACWWTELPLERVARYWLFDMPLYFAANSQGLGPGPLADRFGLSVRLVQGIALAVLGCIGLATAQFWGRRVDRLAIAPLAGVLAVLGELFLYHYHYDNIMLVPAVIGILGIAASARSPATVVLASLMLATLYVPHRLMTQIPFNGIGRTAIWSVVGAVLLAHSVDWRRRASADGEKKLPRGGDAARERVVP